MQLKRASIFGFLACTLSVGCGSEDETARSAAALEQALSDYASIVHASYEDSAAAAETLEVSVEALLSEPSEQGLSDARKAWLAAREPYLQTEVYRFYDGPIDNPKDGPEGLMNAWPLDEAYIDYVEDDPSAGIINDADTELDAESLIALNERGGEENIATGYHAIEFLLWGQDFNDDGPGDRPFTDYVAGESASSANAERRGSYLRLVTQLLGQHLNQLVAEWAPGAAGNYRGEFTTIEPKQALARILTGMIVLSGFETGGERLQTALDSGDQEDEHSCFSDNTHRDMVQDVQGIHNVWHGSYERLDGSVVTGIGVRDVVEAEHAELAALLDAQIAHSLERARALVPPFDREIAIENGEGRQRVQALVTALREQEQLLEDVFVLFELNVPSAE